MKYPIDIVLERNTNQYMENKMTIQLISVDEKNIINLDRASIVSNTDSGISVLVQKTGTAKDVESFLEEGVLVSIHHDQENIETKDFYTRSSIVDGGGEAGLLGTQIIIDFEKA